MPQLRFPDSTSVVPPGRRARVAGLLGLGLAAALVVAACAKSPAASGSSSTSAAAAPPTASSPASSSSAGSSGAAAASGIAGAGELDGRSFTSTKIQGFTPVSGVPVTLAFADHGLRAYAGCNSIFGQVQTTGGVLMAPTLAMTMRACPSPQGDQDKWVHELLTGQPKWSLAGSTLTLTGAAGSVTFSEDTASPPAGGPTGWRLTGIGTATGTVTPVPQGVDAWLITKDGEVSLKTGCNGGGGDYKLEGSTLVFGPVRTTMMFCEGAAGEVERAVLKVLGTGAIGRVDGDSLVITSGPGQGELIFAKDPAVVSSAQASATK